MSKSALLNERFHDEAKAFEYVEAQLWANGPFLFCSSLFVD